MSVYLQVYQLNTINFNYIKQHHTIHIRQPLSPPEFKKDLIVLI